MIRAAGLNIEAICSGKGTCGKCRVRVDGAEGLACRTAAKDGMRVEIMASSEEHVILTDSISGSRSGGSNPLIARVAKRSEGIEDEWIASSSSTPRNDEDELTPVFVSRAERTELKQRVSRSPQSPVAFAIDVGTTTVVVKAIDTGSGEEIGVRAFANPQRVYGADVLSRINNAMDDASLLSGIITSAIDGAVLDIMKSEAAGAGTEKIVIAGNTTMSYLLINRRCRSLGLAPFEPEYSIEPLYEYSEVFGKETLSCPVLVYPYISAFVGGDIVSGLVNIERHLEREKDPSYMLIDMGTNGELAYRNGMRLLTTSTAAGPALEGGNITCGMSGLPGAIYAATYEGAGKFSVRTIGDKPALGICGSGVISLMAALLGAGLVSGYGAFTEEGERLAEIAEPGTEGSSPSVPVKQLVIAEGGGSAGGERIIFTQKDVREFQLAKGAVRAGLDILAEEMGELPGMLYLAGGFGQNIDLDSAFRTGLIPRSLEGQIRFAGNTSLGGCIDACMESGAKGPLPSLDIISAAEEINLGSHKRFNDKFMETMLFD